MYNRFLIDNFTGNPEEFYALVIEEINLRQLPEVQFRWVEEAESEKRFFNKGDKARALAVAFRSETIVVFAYQIGGCFFVSSRVTHRFRDPDKSTFLYEAIMFTFEQIVERAAKRALARHMESKSASAPSFLAVNDNVMITVPVSS